MIVKLSLEFLEDPKHLIFYFLSISLSFIRFLFYLSNESPNTTSIKKESLYIILFNVLKDGYNCLINILCFKHWGMLAFVWYLLHFSSLLYFLILFLVVLFMGSICTTPNTIKFFLFLLLFNPKSGLFYLPFKTVKSHFLSFTK